MTINNKGTRIIVPCADAHSTDMMKKLTLYFQQTHKSRSWYYSGRHQIIRGNEWTSSEDGWRANGHSTRVEFWGSQKNKSETL